MAKMLSTLHYHLAEGLAEPLVQNSANNWSVNTWKRNNVPNLLECLS
jgi:hypothetical protein